MRATIFNTGKFTKRASLILMLFVTVFASCSNDTSDIDEVYTRPTENAAPASDYNYSSLELEVLDLVNEYRAENGLPQLEIMPIISIVAETHTDYMLNQQKASHDNFPLRSQRLKNEANAKSVGENVAFGFHTAKGAVNGWKNSEGHKEILDTAKYTHFGISTKSDNDGRNYFTLLFIEK